MFRLTKGRRKRYFRWNIVLFAKALALVNSVSQWKAAVLVLWFDALVCIYIAFRRHVRVENSTQNSVLVSALFPHILLFEISINRQMMIVLFNEGVLNWTSRASTASYVNGAWIIFLFCMDARVEQC